MFGKEAYRAQTISMVTSKQIDPSFTQILVRGIGTCCETPTPGCRGANLGTGCNWLVTLACFLSLQGRDIWSKILGLWWPIFGFVSLGFDNLVANMFFIPMGLWVGTPGLTVGLYIWKGIIPALIGNILGGSIFVGGYYWWIHLALEEEIAIDGSILGVKASERNKVENCKQDSDGPETRSSSLTDVRTWFR